MIRLVKSDANKKYSMLIAILAVVLVVGIISGVAISGAAIRWQPNVRRRAALEPAEPLSGKADLVVTDIKWLAGVGADRIDVIVTVRNQGTGDVVAGVDYSFAQYSLDYSKTISTARGGTGIFSIKPSEEKTFEMYAVYQSSVIAISLDPQNIIPESDDNNNRKDVKIYLTGEEPAASSSTSISKVIQAGYAITDITQKEYFPNPITSNHLNFLQKTAVSFNGKNVPVHDEIWFEPFSPSVENTKTLTIPDVEYGNNIAIEFAVDSIYYYYVFDEAIDVSTASKTNPLNIKFFGRDLKIIGVGWANGQAERIIVDDNGKAVTYRDNQEFIGEDTRNEYWRWDIANLQQSQTTKPTAAGTATGPVLALKSYFVIDDDFDNNPTAVVNCGCYDITTQNPCLQLCMDAPSGTSRVGIPTSAKIILRATGKC